MPGSYLYMIEKIQYRSSQFFEIFESNFSGKMVELGDAINSANRLIQRSYARPNTAFSVDELEGISDALQSVTEKAIEIRSTLGEMGLLNVEANK